MGEEYKGGWKLNDQGPQIDQLLGMVSAANAAASGNGLQGNMGFVEDTTYSGCFYRNVTVNNQTIREWLNPPLAGTEYRTTERYNGRAVYQKVLNLGALKDQSTNTGSNWQQPINAGISNLEEVLSVTGHVKHTVQNTTETFPIQYAANSNSLVHITFWQNEVLILYPPNVQYDWSVYNAYAVLKYTKNS